MRYYIAKSGLPMYDLTRTYGLGYILNQLCNSDVSVKDFGYYYFIEVNAEPSLDNVRKLSILTGEDLQWDRVFFTLKRAQRENKRSVLEKVLLNEDFIREVLDTFQELREPVLLSTIV